MNATQKEQQINSFVAFGLLHKTAECLWEGGIQSPEDLCLKTEQEIRIISGIGEARLKEILSTLAKKGIVLPKGFPKGSSLKRSSVFVVKKNIPRDTLSLTQTECFLMFKGVYKKTTIKEESLSVVGRMGRLPKTTLSQLAWFVECCFRFCAIQKQNLCQNTKDKIVETLFEEGVACEVGSQKTDLKTAFIQALHSLARNIFDQILSARKAKFSQVVPGDKESIVLAAGRACLTYAFHKCNIE